MMKTIRDKAVTNQSHCKTQRTAKDISEQSSHALVRRGKTVTAHSHAAMFTLRSRRKALCSCYFSIPSHPSLVVPPRSLLHFCHRLVMLHPACGAQTEGCGQHWYEWTGGCVLLRLLEWRLNQSSLSLSQKQTPTPNTYASTQQTHTQHVHQYWHFVTPAQFFLFPSVFVLCSFYPVLLLISAFNPVLILLFASLFHPPYTHSLLQWPSADLTRAVYYKRMS